VRYTISVKIDSQEVLKNIHIGSVTAGKELISQLVVSSAGDIQAEIKTVWTRHWKDGQFKTCDAYRWSSKEPVWQKHNI
jgi:hypothetical protein